MNYLYAPDFVTERHQIFSEIGDAIGDHNQVEMFEDLEKVSARLKKFSTPEIIIMLAIGKEEMPIVISFSNLFRDASVIIMLSEENPKMISSAIKMKPRFIGIMDGDLDKIVPVVKKLMRKKFKRPV